MINLEPKELLQQFASDNYAGICPEAWSASEGANQGHATSYGDDPWTARASDAFRELFECECDVYFVFNGTAANSLALASLCQSYHGVICCDQAHVETDECGAPEFFSNGSKLLVAPSADGKLTPDAIHELATKRQDIHYPKPRAVTLTQSTETGRVYTLAELGAISDECKTHGLSLHMDGARFANACASLGCRPAELTWKSGVDVLCFTAASRPVNLLQKCASFPLRGWECWRAALGSATLHTPINVRNTLLNRSWTFQVCGSPAPSKPMQHFLKHLKLCLIGSANADGGSIALSEVRRASCLLGIQTLRASTNSAVT